MAPSCSPIWSRPGLRREVPAFDHHTRALGITRPHGSDHIRHARVRMLDLEVDLSLCPAVLDDDLHGSGGSAPVARRRTGGGSHAPHHGGGAETALLIELVAGNHLWGTSAFDHQARRYRSGRSRSPIRTTDIDARRRGPRPSLPER